MVDTAEEKIVRLVDDTALEATTSTALRNRTVLFIKARKKALKMRNPVMRVKLIGLIVVCYRVSSSISYLLFLKFGISLDSLHRLGL
jgi:hypothetical protein